MTEMDRGEREEQQPWLDQGEILAISHPLRIEILRILARRVASPNIISRALKQKLGDVSYHTAKLVELGKVEEVERVRRRGAFEHFYRALPRSGFAYQVARLLPGTLGGEAAAGTLGRVIEESAAAIESGTLERRPETAFSLQSLSLDEAGWRQLGELASEALDRAAEIQAESRARQGSNGTQSIPATFFVAAFESGPNG